MNVISFEELAKSKKELEELLRSLDLKLRQGSWLQEAYSTVQTLANVWRNDDLRREFLEKNNDSKVFTSLYDISSIHEVLPLVDNEDKKTLKQKFRKVLKMTLPSIETIKNNEARNILWELVLFSVFKRIGLDVSLGNPNPDIFLSFDSSHKYYIQCKRIYSEKENALQRNIDKAAKQLRKDLDRKDRNSFGLIALSLERPFLNTDRFSFGLMPKFKSEKDARNELKTILDKIINKQQKLWKEKKIIKSQRILGILFYIRVSCIIGSNKIFSPGSQMSIFPLVFNGFIEDDFGSLKGLIEY